MRLDLVATCQRVLTGALRSSTAMETSLAAAAAPACTHAFISIAAEQARSVAAAADAQISGGLLPAPLAGIAISIKDLFGVAGEVTSAGSALLVDSAPALVDATAVARLRHAGAAFIGRSNMAEFAYSGVGQNPHFGTPANPATANLDPVPRIPGGSTSGGAVSVAAGAAWAALGSDTGGSLRIPAALQGLVGFKPTARRVPTQGAFPLSTTLDSVGAITLSVRDAALLHGILAARLLRPDAKPMSSLRFGLPQTLMLEGLDATVGRAFERSLGVLSAAGAKIEPIALPLLDDVAAINAGGGFAAAESWALHRHRLQGNEAAIDRRVAARIRRGEALSAADYIDLVAARAAWIRRLEAALAEVDVLIAPTVPIVAPPLAPLLDDDAAFFATNNLLLRNPAVVNFADGCALSLPCHIAGEMPVGLMLWSTAWRDDDVLAAGFAVEAALGAV
ncbi:MAG: amidase [Pseudomonadota bacterium]|nr:amidase [Pseudomonadota bacterium]